MADIPLFESDWKRIAGPRQWWVLAAFVALAALLGMPGSLAAPNASHTSSLWYEALHKPGWILPVTALAALWIPMHALMSYTTWRVWRAPFSVPRQRALRLYMLQLAFNAAWMPLFFGIRSPSLALADVVTLWATLLWARQRFEAVDTLAGRLVDPYRLWVSLVLVLNLAIVVLN